MSFKCFYHFETEVYFVDVSPKYTHVFLFAQNTLKISTLPVFSPPPTMPWSLTVWGIRAAVAHLLFSSQSFCLHINSRGFCFLPRWLVIQRFYLQIPFSYNAYLAQKETNSEVKQHKSSAFLYVFVTGYVSCQRSWFKYWQKYLKPVCQLNTHGYESNVVLSVTPQF